MVYAAHRLMEQATLSRVVEGLQPGDLAKMDQGHFPFERAYGSCWRSASHRPDLVTKLLEAG